MAKITWNDDTFSSDHNFKEKHISIYFDFFCIGENNLRKEIGEIKISTR